jgi:1,4-dihydroxy-2-naphthoate octaprenyltransferase
VSNAARAWLMACRPATLTAAVAPVAVGSACAAAAGHFRPGPAAAALAGAMLLQIGANLANDVFDFEKGADGADRLGPTRVVAAGLLPAARVRVGMAAAFALATVVGVYLALVAGSAVVVIGLASIVAAVAYTAGPWPLGYHGLGDLFVLLFFGFVAVCGTAYVQVGAIPPLAWLAALPVGALATCVLVVNNVRDVVSDTRAGKRTLAVRLGRHATELEYGALLAIAYLTPIVMVATRQAGLAALLPLATAPFGIALLRQLRARSGRALNATLAATARLLLGHAVLLTVGLTVGG